MLWAVRYEFKNSFIEQKYYINTKPASPVNQHLNAPIDRIHQVIWNLVRTYNLHKTYVDDAGPWMGILASPSFTV